MSWRSAARIVLSHAVTRSVYDASPRPSGVKKSCWCSEVGSQEPVWLLVIPRRLIKHI